MRERNTKRLPRDMASMVDVANSILTVALLKPERLLEIDLAYDHFPLAWQQDVWAAIQYLFTSKSVVDLVLVHERLTQTGKEVPDDDGKKKPSWLGFLSQVINNNPAAYGNIRHYIDSLVNWHRRTRCAEIGSLLQERSMNGEDGSDDAIRDLMALSLSTKVMDGPLADSIPEAIDALDIRFNKKSKIHGIPFGIAGLDRLMAGMQKSHLIVLAGRPSMGKTAAALNVCQVNRKRKIGFISTEQPRKEMIDRLVSIHGGIDSQAIRTGTVADADWPKIMETYREIGEWPLYMVDRPAPDITDVVRQSRKWKHRFDIELLIVDYIQRVKDRSTTKRHEEVGGVAMTLKNLARELEIPVLALSQINRDVEKRENKRPVLSDLRESGDIEQESDIIITMYRDEVYYERDNNKGKAEYGVPKNRHGPTGIAYCHYEGKYFRFEDFGIDQPELLDAPIPEPTGQPFHYHPE